ncbi:hypothetical protein U771_21095 [Pseudomonas gorinensis]|uniref:Uncharacterized protein n=1 Tax=Pseudomonas gorinensis TaxID=3240790 RepID=A0ACA7PAK6_9PSED|nr:hypothetical protein U771_21095 [Pseudomonas sp. TKP]
MTPGLRAAALGAVGASVLAMYVNDNAGNQSERGVLELFASTLAPTQIQAIQ